MKRRRTTYWKLDLPKRSTYGKLKAWGDSRRCPKCGAKLVEGRALCSLCGYDKE